MSPLVSSQIQSERGTQWGLLLEKQPSAMSALMMDSQLAMPGFEVIHALSAAKQSILYARKT